MTAPLLLTEARIRDVLGCEAQTIQLGRCTVITGRNATGKTTVLDSIASAIGRVSLAGLEHRGGSAPARPRVQLLLEGDGRAVTIERDAGGQTLGEWSSDDGAFVSQPKPGERVLGLVDALAANPIAFLRAKPGDQLKMLLAAQPIELDRRRASKLVEPSGVVLRLPDTRLHGLTELELARGQVYEARMTVNRDRDREEHVATTLQPVELGAAPDVAAAEKSLEKAQAAERRQRQGILDDARQARGSAQAARDELVRDSEVDLQIAIDRAREEHRERVAAADKAAAHAKAAADSTEQDGLAALAPLEQAVREARDRKTAAVERQRAYDEAAGQRKAAQASRAKADALATRSAAMTDALAALDAYRVELCSSLPAGLTIVEGELCVDVDGVALPFAQANTAARLRAAALVAAERVKRLPWPIVLIDNGEALDAENRMLLLRELYRLGVQVVMAVVDGAEHPGPFRAEILDEQLKAAA